MPRGAIPEYPPILRGTVEEQMIQLREYIIRNIEAMQRDLTASGGTIYVDNGVAYVTINGSTMTLQEFIENYVNEDGNTINVTVNATIETNPDLQEKTFNVTENGDFSVLPDADKDGLSKVNLHVTVPADGPSGTIQITENGTVDVTDYANAAVNVQPDLQAKSITITENGTQTVMPDTGKDGLTSVEITVSVPSSAPNLQSKNATPSGSEQTIQPDSGYDGLSSVIIAAAPLETKNVTPSASQQIITPSSGQYGMSQVTVAGDADLIAGNIKKDIVIFGITGTYEGSSTPVNGSLIVATCSSNITAVTATIGSNTFTAYLNTSTHKAYITIPYTITSGTVRVHGYVNGTEKTWADVTLSGIDKYTVALNTSAYLFRNGSWYGLDSHEWVRYAPSTYAGTINVSESSNVLTLALSPYTGGGTRYAWEYLKPLLSNRGYSQLEIVVDSVETTDAVCAQCVTSISQIQSVALSVGTNVIPCATDGFYLEFYMNDWTTRTVNTAVISSIRFV